jgi:chromosome segregation ATPase
VSVDLALPLKSLQLPLHDSIRELRRGHQSVSECLEQVLAECDQRGVELAECRRQLADASRELIEREKTLAERTQAAAEAIEGCCALKKQLEAIQSDLARASDERRQAQAEALQSKERLEVQVEHKGQLQSQLERFQSENEASRIEVAQLRSQLAPLAETTVESAKLRGELAAAQTEMVRLREQLAAVPNETGLHEQLAEAQDERQQLEAELDVLRARGAELTESLAEQKRLTAEERDQWSEELRQLRRSVDRQSELLVKNATASATTASSSPPAPSAADAGRNGDAVVDTVREQFEMLQRNKVRKLADAS